MRETIKPNNAISLTPSNVRETKTHIILENKIKPVSIPKSKLSSTNIKRLLKSENKRVYIENNKTYYKIHIK